MVPAYGTVRTLGLVRPTGFSLRECADKRCLESCCSLDPWLIW